MSVHIFQLMRKITKFIFNMVWLDYPSHVPTNLGREIDILLIFGNLRNSQIVSYDIIEVKCAEFDSKALVQLIDYESWFLQKKVSGDLNMIRTMAIARNFSDNVINYVKNRKFFENKPITLLTYHYLPNELLSLQQIL